jgi:site-specific recombinase XerD
VSESPAPLSYLVIPLGAGASVPELFQKTGDRGAYHYAEFFTATIRNPHTRRAYARAALLLSDWCSLRELELPAVTPIHLAAFVEELGSNVSPPTVKQALAAIRALFDHLVMKQVIPFNPAQNVRGPRYVVKKGKTQVPSAEEARALLSAIPADSVKGLRDRALLSLMLYTFARIDAALSMRVEDYFPMGKRFWVRLHEKNGKEHEMPVHHSLEEALDAYLDASGIRGDKRSPLFRSIKGQSDALTEKALQQANAWRMVRRWAMKAGVETALCNHSFRAFGITAYLKNGGSLEKAQKMAAHEDPRTTKLYDRTSDEVSLDEVERIVF